MTHFCKLAQRVSDDFLAGDHYIKGFAGIIEQSLIKYFDSELARVGNQSLGARGNRQNIVQPDLVLRSALYDLVILPQPFDEETLVRKPRLELRHRYFRKRRIGHSIGARADFVISRMH